MRTLGLLLIYFVVGCWVGAAYGQSNGVNIAIPNTNQNFATDRIRAGDAECSMSIGSSTNVEFGVAGILNQNDPFYYDPYQPPMTSNEFVRDIAVYGKITIPIGAPKKRLNCDLLYQLELEKKRLEVMKLRQEIINLKNMQFMKEE